MMSILANEAKITDVEGKADANTAKAEANMMAIMGLSPVDITALEMQVEDNTEASGANAAAISSNLDKIMMNSDEVGNNKAANDMQDSQISMLGDVSMDNMMLIQGNTDSISTNAEGIMTNKDAVSANKDSIDANSDKITANMMSIDANVMELAMLSNLIENIPDAQIDPAMLSDIMADIAANSDKIGANMMSVDATAMSVAMLSDDSAMMMMNVDMNSD